jgi:hypothetical protein
MKSTSKKTRSKICIFYGDTDGRLLSSSLMMTGPRELADAIDRAFDGVDDVGITTLTLSDRAGELIRRRTTTTTSTVLCGG